MINLQAHIVMNLFYQDEGYMSIFICNYYENFEEFNLKSNLITIIFFMDIFDIMINKINTKTNYITFNNSIYSNVEVYNNFKHNSLYKIYDFLIQGFITISTSNFTFDRSEEIDCFKYIILEVINKCFELDADESINYFENKLVIPQVNIPSNAPNRKAKDKTIDMTPTIQIVDELFNLFRKTQLSKQVTLFTTSSHKIWNLLQKYCSMKLFLINRYHKQSLLTSLIRNLNDYSLICIEYFRTYLSRKDHIQSSDEDVDKNSESEDDSHQKSHDDDSLLENLKYKIQKPSYMSKPSLPKLLSNKDEFEKYCHTIYCLQSNFTYNEFAFVKPEFISNLYLVMNYCFNEEFLEICLNGSFFLIKLLKFIDFDFRNKLFTKFNKNADVKISERFILSILSYIDKVSNKILDLDIVISEVVEIHFMLLSNNLNDHIKKLLTEIEYVDKYNYSNSNIIKLRVLFGS